MTFPCPSQVALPSESATGTCFLELYAQFILALQVGAGVGAGGCVGGARDARQDDVAVGRLQVRA